MGEIRMDKFVKTDKLTWANDHFATMTNGRSKLGDGPFEIVAIMDRENDYSPFDDGQSMWSSMGHTQHIIIKGWDDMFSGAFFKKVE